MSPGRFEQGQGCARTELHMSMGGVMKRSMGVLAGMLVAVGCGQPIQEHTSGVELTGGRAGQVAIIPEVDVVGLEELTDRTAGTVFVEEVLMHADGVRVWEPSGHSAELAGSDHFFLRYNPSAGASGLTRLWAPADGRYSDLTVQVGPLSMNQDMLTQLSRERGFDLALLQDASIVIRGMMAVGAAAGGTPGLEAQALKEGCGVACEGTTPDTGLPARELWIAYLEDHENIGPDFASQQVDETGMPATVKPGVAVSFTLDKLNLTSLGSPANTQVRVYAHTPTGQIELGTFPVTNGSAAVSFTVPATVPARSPLVVTAAPSMTTVGKGLRVASLTATGPAQMTYGSPEDVTVAVAPSDATGTVQLRDGATLLGSGMVSGGLATVTIAGDDLTPGTHSLIVTYSGDDDTAAASTAVSVTVAKATPHLTPTKSPTKVVDKKTSKTLVAIDKRYYRPAEVDHLEGDPSKAKRVLCWKHNYDLKALVK